MDEHKLNRKLAEWVGIKWKITERTHNHLEQDIWVYPDGTIKDEPPNFTKSLDACFKWLVPKLLEQDIDIALFIDKGELAGVFLIPPDIHKRITADAECLALALCLAIEKLIDGGLK